MAQMARAGFLHVTVITATLLRDPSGSDSGPIETYASVGCGNQSFTTNSVKNHNAKPSWNESYTFKFEECFRSELEAQHILIEIFTEKPKLDELLGLAKIPLKKVINVGDEISTHSLNRPDEEYGGHELYSGHVKVALRWDSATRLPAYPQAYTPAARYNPNASTATQATVVSKSNDQLQTSKSSHEQQLEENQNGAPARKAHQRSSSCPSRSFRLHPAPALSPRAQNQETDSTSNPGDQSSTIQPAGAHPLPGSAPHRSSFEDRPSSLPQQDSGLGPGPHLPYAGPHVPYVSYEGSKACAGITGLGPMHPLVSETSNANHQDDASKQKFSRAKQAEMAKLAELSRLTESAKIQATGFAKAAQQPTVRTKQSSVQVRPQPQNEIRATPKPAFGDAVPLQNPPIVNNTSSNSKGSELPPPRLSSQQQVPIFQEKRRDEAQSRRDGSQRFEHHNKQLAVVPTMLDVVHIQQQTSKAQRDERQAYTKQLYVTSPRKADVFYEKAIQKVDRKPEQKTGSAFRRTLKLLRKTTKIFGM